MTPTILVLSMLACAAKQGAKSDPPAKATTQRSSASATARTSTARTDTAATPDGTSDTGAADTGDPARDTPGGPDDEASLAFYDGLFKVGLFDLRPSDDPDLGLVYRSLRLKPDNTWVASAYVRQPLGGEPDPDLAETRPELADEVHLPCEERGTWILREPALSESVGLVSLQVTKSTCETRDGVEQVVARIDLSQPSGPRVSWP